MHKTMGLSNMCMQVLHILHYNYAERETLYVAQCIMTSANISTKT